LRLTGRLALVPSRVAVEVLLPPARIARFGAFPDAFGFALERFVARAAFAVFTGLDGPLRLAADFVAAPAAFFAMTFLATAFFAVVFLAADLPAPAFVDTDFFEAVFFAAFVFTPVFFEPDFFAAAFLRGLVVLIDGSS